MTKVIRTISMLLKPVWRQLPLLLALIVLLSPDTCITIADITKDHAWTGLSHDYRQNVLYFAALAFLWAYIITFIVDYAGKYQKTLKVIVYIIAVVHFATILFIRQNFGTNISPQVLQIMAESNGGEVMDFFATFGATATSIKVYGVVAIMVVAIILFEHFYSRQSRFGNRPFLRIVVGIALIALLGCGVYCSRIVIKMLSCKTMEQLEDCEVVGDGTGRMDGPTALLYSFHAMHLSGEKTKSFRQITLDELHHGDAAYCGGDSTLNVVLIIGESYIKSHASIYGYELNTTPKLKQEMEQGRLMVFSDVVAPYNTTASVLKNMFSCNTANEKWWNAPLFMAAFKHAGFDVFIWDNQRNQQEWLTTAFTFSMESFLYDNKVRKECYKMLNSESFEYDGDLVDDFSQQVIKASKIGKQNLIIFHLLGQHFDASNRYPKSYNHFTADSVSRHASYLTPANRGEIAHYDNATLYNDVVVKSIIDLVSETNCVVIYTSDHGEEVYDYRDNMGRAEIGKNQTTQKTPQLVKYQNEVPFVIWFSPRYKLLHPEMCDQMAKAVNVPFMNTDISQMLFYLSQVETKHYNSQSNPLSPNFKPSCRIIYDSIDYDRLMKGQNK